MVNKRLYFFLIAEFLILIALILAVVLKYKTLVMLILLGSPLLLIGGAVIAHLFSDAKTPQKIIISIVVYVIVALNVFSIIDPDVVWRGILTPSIGKAPILFNEQGEQIVGTGDEGVTNAVYIYTLLLTGALVVIYELFLFVKKLLKSKITKNYHK